LSKSASMQVDADTVLDPIASIARRAPNVRPVDLAKSASDEDSTFVRLNVSSSDSKSKDKRPDAMKTESSESAKPEYANPFLKDNSTKQTKVVPAPANQDDTSSMAVPDQIQRLSDSIAKFANPKKLDQNRER
jgi:hypothetical protein